MNKLFGSLGLLAALLLAEVAQAGSVFPLPPFIVYGKVRDWNGRVLTSEDAAVVIARDTNGTELARCNVASGIYPDLTYRLSIPLASGTMAGRGQVGEPLVFEVDYDGVAHAAATSQTIPIGNPASTLSCTLMLGTYSYNDQLPDEYLELLLSYYQAAGRTNDLAGISPDDDFDGDGFSNFQEFIAGTIPVMSEDFLRIVGLTSYGTNSQALSFLSAPGRTYAIPTTTALGSNNWGHAYFRAATNAVSAQDFYVSDADATITLYVVPTTNASYYGLEVE